MPVGHPTDYRPEYCELLVKTMSQGDTLACFCADVGIARETAYAWMKTHTQFSDAYKKGQENALRFWEKVLARCALGMPIKIDQKECKNYNIVAMIFLMKARFKDYREQLVVQNQEINYEQPESLTLEAETQS